MKDQLGIEILERMRHYSYLMENEETGAVYRVPTALGKLGCTELLQHDWPGYEYVTYVFDDNGALLGEFMDVQVLPCWVECVTNVAGDDYFATVEDNVSRETNG